MESASQAAAKKQVEMKYTRSTLPILFYSDNDCVEVTIRNFLNHVLFNQTEQKLDLTRIPYLNPKLAAFFQAHPTALEGLTPEYQQHILGAYNDFRTDMNKLASAAPSITPAQRIHIVQELANNLSNPKATPLVVSTFLLYLLVKDSLMATRLAKFVEVNEKGPPISSREDESTPDSEVEINLPESRNPHNAVELREFFEGSCKKYVVDAMTEVAAILPKDINFKGVDVTTTNGYVSVQPIFVYANCCIGLQLMSYFNVFVPPREQAPGYVRYSGHAVFDRSFLPELID